MILVLPILLDPSCYLCDNPPDHVRHLAQWNIVDSYGNDVYAQVVLPVIIVGPSWDRWFKQSNL
jgi:hypothetical protein